MELAKPRNDPDGRHLSAFTYLRLNQALLEEHNLGEFHLFVKRMHGTYHPLPIINFHLILVTCGFRILKSKYDLVLLGPPTKIYE